MRRIIFELMVILVLASCQKEKITLGEGISESFYVDNNGASMRVLIEGNTGSKVFIIFVHGGPGVNSFFFNTDYISKNIEDKYACVYWDERNAGGSQGNSNGKYLNLAQMTEDLKKVIQVLKNRYGQDSGVFILGHSFGGLLTSSFMTTGNFQSMVKGWIYADGSHDYPLNDTLTRQMLLTYGQQQIALKKNIDKWKPIVKYCTEHPGNFTLKESDQLMSYASEAETYFDEVKKPNIIGFILENVIEFEWPITSMLVNLKYSTNAGFNRDLAKTRFTPSLYKVVTPTLIMFGNYDFICPKELGEDLFNHISTTDKKIVISLKSGHGIYLQDESFFCTEVNKFIEQYK